MAARTTPSPRRPRPWGQRSSPARQGAAARSHAGVAAATTPWVLILHADTHLGPDWVEAAARHHMQAHPDNAGWFHLKFRATGLAPRIVAGGANLRSRFLGLPYGDQGLLVARQTLDEVGGIPDLPLMEDVALARRLKSRLRPLGPTAHTSASRYQAQGWTRRTLANLTTLACYALGTSPKTLAKTYEKSRSTPK